METCIPAHIVVIRHSINCSADDMRVVLTSLLLIQMKGLDDYGLYRTKEKVKDPDCSRQVFLYG